jgi:hypothetical protein
VIVFKKIILSCIIFILTACSNQEPVQGLSSLGLEGLEVYSGAEDNMLDRVTLNLNQVWGRKLPQTAMNFYYLPPDSPFQDETALTEFYTQNLDALGWAMDKENSFTDVHIVFTRESRIGKQTLAITRIALLADDGVNVYREDAILMVSLYPIPK